MTVPRHDISILLSGLLILIFAIVHPSLAQQAPDAAKKAKKIVILKTITDGDGKVQNIRIEKEGKDAENFDVEKFMKENDTDIQIKNNINKEINININEAEIKENITENHSEVIVNEHGTEKRIVKKIIIKDDSLANNRPFLGVELNENVIEHVVENSPAERAGLKENDRILAVNTDKIRGYDDLIAALRKYKPEETVNIQYEREGKTAITKVTLTKKKRVDYTSDEFRMMDDGCCKEKWSETFKELKDRPRLGVEVGEKNNLKGALLTKVYEKSGAAEAGLQQGDIIYEMDGKAITNDKDLTEAVRTHKAGDILTIKYRRDGEKLETNATLNKNADGIGNMNIKIFKDKNEERQTMKKGDIGRGLQLENYEFFPNPTQNSIKLRFTTRSDEAVDIRLVDGTGKEIYKEAVKDMTNRTYDKAIDFTGKPEGVYILHIMQGGQTFTRQLVYAKR
jgi:membrane-associated protease RseP (regulator of RpoE activity)